MKRVIEKVMTGTRKFDEATVLEQAVNVFWSKGYTATTMLELSKETGVQRGSLYHAYRDKNTLFLKAFQQYANGYFKLIGSQLKQENAYTALSQFFEDTAQRLNSDKDHKGCFSTRTVMEASQQCESIKHSLRQFLDTLEQIIEQRLTKAVKDQQFTGEPKTTARYLVALTRGMAVIERIYSDNKHIQDIYQTTLKQLPFTPETIAKHEESMSLPQPN